MYEIVLLAAAQEDLERLRAYARTTVLDVIETHLRQAPRRESRSRIKRLRGRRELDYRLRIGSDLRVFYRVEGRHVLVQRVLFKEEARAYYDKEGDS